MTTDSEAPHTAVLCLTIEVHAKLPSGEMAGNPIRKEKKIMRIDGTNRLDCINKLEYILGEIKKCSS